MSTNVLIAFYSKSGVTEALAVAIAEGAKSHKADVRLRRAREIVDPDVVERNPDWAKQAARMNQAYEPPTIDDAVWADAIVFGTPTRFGIVATPLKAYIDRLGSLWTQGKLNGKVGSVFATSQTPHGGNETTLTSLYHPLAHLGLIIVPLGYAYSALYKAGSPYGATAISGDEGNLPTADDLDVAQFQGRRVVQVAAALKAAGVITGSGG